MSFVYILIRLCTYVGASKKIIMKYVVHIMLFLKFIKTHQKRTSQDSQHKTAEDRQQRCNRTTNQMPVNIADS